MIFNFFKDIDEDELEEQEEIEKYRCMSAEQVASLSGDEYISAVYYRIFGKVIDEGIDSLSKEARIYYVVEAFSLEHFEYAKGSLIEGVFTGEEFKYASELCDAFDAIGAAPYRELFKKFLDQNGLDAAVLQGMPCRDLMKALRRCKGFKGKDFDKQYEALSERKPLDDIITSYVLTNRDKLVHIK